MGKATHRRTYFVLNKESDFKKGCRMRIRADENGIALKEDAREGVYYTKIFDSRERLMEWHRLLLSVDAPQGTSWTVTVYAADSLMLTGREAGVWDIITDGSLAQEMRDEILGEYCRTVWTNARDMLLFDVKGRYLWLKITLKAQGENVPRISRIQVCFPKHTWLMYLPEIYQESQADASFLERYLGIFQSLYEDMTEKIERTPGLLEPSVEEKELLHTLADWFAIEGRDLWSDSQLLYLVQQTHRMRRMRGTVPYLKELVKLYAGREPYVVEYHRIQPYFDGGYKEQLLKGLYTSHRWQFAVLIDGEGMEQKQRIAALREVVELAKPAHMECRIVVLKPYIFLDRHSYLGINSVLGQYRPFRLDGLCAVPFSVISK